MADSCDFLVVPRPGSENKSMEELMADVTDRESLAVVGFNSSLPILKQLLSHLPWGVGPSDHATLPFAAFMAASWALFRLEDPSPTALDPILCTMPWPDSVGRAWVQLKEMGFRIRPYASLTLLVQDVQRFVQQHPSTPEFLWTEDKRCLIEGPNPDEANEHPPQGLDCVDAMTMQHFTNDCGSLAPLCVFEIASAPRLIPQMRYRAMNPLCANSAILLAYLFETDAALGPLCGNNARLGIRTAQLNNLLQSQAASSIAKFFVNSDYPMSLLPLHMGTLQNTCTIRATIAPTLVNLLSSNTSSQRSIYQARFKQYAQAWTHIDMLLGFTSSSADALRAVELIAATVAPHATIMTSVVMSTIDNAIKDLVPKYTIPTDPGLPTWGFDDRVDGLIKAFQTHKVATSKPLSTSSAPSSDTSGIGAPELVENSPEIEKWSHAEVVSTLEADLKDALHPNTQDPNFAIHKAMRSGLPLVMQLLCSKRTKLPNADVLNQLPSMRAYKHQVMAFHISAERDGDGSLVQPPYLVALQGKILPKAFDALWTMDFSHKDANLYDINYIMATCSHGIHAASAKPSDTRFMYSDVGDNNSIMELGDKICFLMGYNNGVFTQHLALANKVLTRGKHLGADPNLDIKVAVTKAVVASWGEIKASYRVMLTSNSPSAILPNGGKSLTDRDGIYRTHLEYLYEASCNPDAHPDIFVTKQRKMDNMVSFMERGLSQSCPMPPYSAKS